MDTLPKRFWFWSERPEVLFASYDKCFDYYIDEVPVNELNGDDGYIDDGWFMPDELEELTIIE